MCPTTDGQVNGVNGDQPTDKANGAMNGDSDEYTAIETKHKYG